MYFDAIPQKSYIKKVFEADWLFIKETINDSGLRRVDKPVQLDGLLLSLYQPGLDT